MLFVDWIFVAPKLKVKLERLVSARINHLETHLNEDIGCWQATEPWGLILCHLLAPIVCYSHLLFTFIYLASVVVTC